MDAAQKRAKRRAKKAIAEQRALEKQRKKKLVEEYKERHKDEFKGGQFGTFLKTFVVLLCLFTAVFTPIIYATGVVADINPFGDDNVALEEALPVLVDSNSPFFAAFTESKKINILVMGVNPPLTDTIMLFCLDPAQEKVDIISVPRDTYYHRDGYNNPAENKINAAYRGNPVNTAYAVSETLMGIPINYYAVVEYSDVEAVVDAMGGVPMYIEKDLSYKDPYDTPPLVIELKAGQQTLNGEDSVKFLRYRAGYKEGDLGRVKAQQQWVKNAIKQGLSLGLGMTDVAKLACKEIDSDVTVGAALKMVTSIVGMSADNVNTYMMPNTPQAEAPYYVFPKTEEIEKMLTEIYSIPTEEETSEGAITGEAISE